MRGTTRRWLAGFATITGLQRRGFFLPYRHAARVRAGGRRMHYPALEARLKACEAGFVEVLATIDGYATDLARIGDDPPPAPRWRQDWFPRLDGAAAYALVRSLKPRRIVEIGSGHSTRFLARATRDGGLATRITAIDPAPRAALAGLVIDWVNSTVEDATSDTFAGLGAGDILMIDSSHVLVPGSDVDILFNAVIPTLPAGAIVHIHDVFLPDDYPPAWDWRGYNEQQAVAGLMTSGGFEILFASHYVASRMRDAVAAGVVGRLAMPDGAFESSLWLRKRQGPARPA